MDEITLKAKTLTEPREKDRTHIASHIEINQLFWLIATEIEKIRAKFPEVMNTIENSNKKAENIVSKLNDAQSSLLNLIDQAKAEALVQIDQANKKEYIKQNFQWVISTSSENTFMLETIRTNLAWLYRIEITNINKSQWNDKIDTIHLPTIDILEWDIIPTIYLKSKWGKATYEYDFDVLVSKL